MTVTEIKSGIATKEFVLTYDRPKDKYYLDQCAYGEMWTETFYGEYALEEYLRDRWQFSQEQINELYSNMQEVA